LRLNKRYTYFYTSIMKIASKIVPVVLGLCLIISACQKAKLNKYDKESLGLKAIKNAEGEIMLEWTPVASSEFVRYEIYRAAKDSFDLTKNTKQIIGTVTDKDISTFNLADNFVATDSLITSGNQFYKVAAVLKDRKVLSKSLTTNANWLLAMPSGGISLAYQNHDDIFIISNNSFQPFTNYIFNTNTNSVQKQDSWPFENLPNTSNILDGIINIGTNAAGAQVIIEPSTTSNSAIVLYKATERSMINKFDLAGVNFIYGVKMIKGVIYALVQTNSGQKLIATFSGTNGSLLSSTFLNSSNLSSPKLEVSEDGTTIVIYENSSFSNIPQLFSYVNNTLSYVSTLVGNQANSGEDIAISSDGNTIIRAGTNSIYNRNGTRIAQFTAGSNFNAAVFILSDESKFIYSNGSGSITLRNCSDASLIKVINTGLNPTTTFNIFPIVVKDKLLVMASIFDGGQSTNILKQVNY
jgi:hypothetical protein